MMDKNKKDIVLILRGHIRNSFKDDKLLIFVKTLTRLFNVYVYAHTWNIYTSNLSWRILEEDNRIVNSDCIQSYLSDSGCIIKSIIIEDDNKINLIGDLCGNIFSSSLPKICWKRMWYGKYNIIKTINDDKDNENRIIINTRFDLFNNSCSNISLNEIIDLVTNIDFPIDKNIFFKESSQLIGVDNCYIGSVHTMYLLAKNFHEELDKLDKIYKHINNQESVVYYENNRLLCNIVDYENIELYSSERFTVIDCNGVKVYVQHNHDTKDICHELNNLNRFISNCNNCIENTMHDNSNIHDFINKYDGFFKNVSSERITNNLPVKQQFLLTTNKFLDL